jgi:hypothetical protein
MSHPSKAKGDRAELEVQELLRTLLGSDDLGVTHWAPITWPDPP